MSRSKRGTQRDVVKSLGHVVGNAARRFFSEPQTKPDPALIADGWERRFMTDAHRAREAMELYEELGYEVRAEPIKAEELSDECEDCQLFVALQFKTIYTRKKA